MHKIKRSTLLINGFSQLSVAYFLSFYAAISQAMEELPLLNTYQPYGLYSGAQFKFLYAQQDCKDCQTVSQALWYFKDEPILVAADNSKIAGFDAKKTPMQDIEDAKIMNKGNTLPPLIWISSNEMMVGKFSAEKQYAINYTLTQNTTMHVLPNRVKKSPLFLVDKIATNLSFWNEKTEAFFDNKSIIARGETTNLGFMARTIWPTDFKLDLHADAKPLANSETLRNLVMFENGGAQSAFESRKLWQKTAHNIPSSYVHPHAEKAVLGIILNGAQGDDDEAHGGHFAVATGKISFDGGINNWLVNNYYNLASNSEKGIIAAPTPLDNYFADVNSGQSYYRPSYMLVAVFNQDTVPARFQAATNRIYNHFYSGNLVYDHSRNNCAGITIDTFRELGWHIPERSIEGRLKALGAYFYVSIKEQDLAKGRNIYDYLTTEKTRLFPAVTFDAMGEDLLQWTRQLHIDHTPATAFTKQLSNDIEAIYFVRIPQIPSSRAFGLAPVYGFDAYLKQAPENRANWKIVPTTDNILPKALKNGLLIQEEKASLVPLPIAIVLGINLMVFVLLVRKIRQFSHQFKSKS